MQAQEIRFTCGVCGVRMNAITAEEASQDPRKVDGKGCKADCPLQHFRCDNPGCALNLSMGKVPVCVSVNGFQAG